MDRQKTVSAFKVESFIRHGDFCDYYQTTVDGTPCVMKVVTDPGDNDLLDQEAKTLLALWSSPIDGGNIFTRYLPRLVAGSQTSDGRAVNILASGEGVYGEYRSLEEIFEAYPEGVSPRHMAWMMNRMLEILSWLHRNGFVHGAVLPPSIMYRPYDHAGALWNWCYATEISKRKKLPAKIDDYNDWYPEGMLGQRPPRPLDDTAMLAKGMIRVVGGNPMTGEFPDHVMDFEPGKNFEPLAQLLRELAEPPAGISRFSNTDDLRREFKVVIAKVFGPKQFIPFIMPTDFRDRHN